MIGDGLASRDNFDDKKKRRHTREGRSIYQTRFENFAHSQHEVTQHAYITIKIYAPACMHNHVAKPMIHFNLEKNISLPIFHEHKNTK